MQNRGFSLIEAMVAMMILSLISGAVILMTLQVLSVANYSRLKNQSTAYAEQVIEQVRDYYQANSWAALAAKGGTVASPRCYTSLTNEITPATNCVNDCSNPGLLIDPQSPFYRYFTLATSGSSYVRVSAVVTWKGKNGCNTTTPTQLDTYFYNY